MGYTTDDFLGGKTKILQDTEGYRATSDAVLVAAAVRAKPGESVLDVGCGTGIILCCLNARVRDLKLTGVELQSDLYELAFRNAALNRFEARLLCENIFVSSSSLHGLQFHHVVTNPPYYTEEFVRQNSQTATAYHQKTELKKWLCFCLKHVRAKGTLTMIHRTEALPQILAVLSESALGAIEVIPIYSKEGGIAKRVIVRGIMGSKKPLELHTGLVMHTMNNERTVTAEKILREGEAIG